MDIQEWYEQKKQAIEATGWRSHGGKVGDKVKLHADWDWHEDDFYEIVDGKERYCELEIKDGAIGTITELLEGDTVKVEFTSLIWYWRKHKKTKVHKRFEFESPHVLELDIVPLSEVDVESTVFDPVLTLVNPPKKPSPQIPDSKQLKLFDTDNP